MLRTISVIVAGSMLAASALAADVSGVKPVPLKDGSTVYVFNDGKMGMEDTYGRATAMDAGHVMETKSGEKIVMKGNEVGRVVSIVGPTPKTD